MNIIEKGDAPQSMVTKKTWQEFRDTGLFLFINSILHVFGWCIIVEVDKKTNSITDAYPARVKFRGFSEDDYDEAHKKIGSYLKDNSQDLFNETQL